MGHQAYFIRIGVFSYGRGENRKRGKLLREKDFRSWKEICYACCSGKTERNMLYFVEIFGFQF